LSVESWTTLPLVEPVKNCTEILADPADFAAVMASARACCSEDAGGDVAADASHVAVKLTRRRPINAIARRVVFALNTAAR
jgi:hypothetical protein